MNSFSLARWYIGYRKQKKEASGLPGPDYLYVAGTPPNIHIRLKTKNINSVIDKIIPFVIFCDEEDQNNVDKAWWYMAVEKNILNPSSSSEKVNLFGDEIEWSEGTLSKELSVSYGQTKF